MATRSGKRGFAAMDQGKHKAIARKGGTSTRGSRAGGKTRAGAQPSEDQDVYEDPSDEMVDDMTERGSAAGVRAAGEGRGAADEEGAEPGGSGMTGEETGADEPSRPSRAGRGKGGKRGKPAARPSRAAKSRATRKSR